MATVGTISPQMTLTDLGRETLAKAVAGQTLHLDRLALGSGPLVVDADAPGMTALGSEKLSVPINSVSRQDSTLTVAAQVEVPLSADLFEWTELGLFGHLDDDAEVLIGYQYWHYGTVQYGDGIERTITITIPVGEDVQIEWDMAKGARTVRLVVGTSKNGWTASDCDYLCDGTDDQVEINAAIAALPSRGGEVKLLDGQYSLSGSIVSGDRAFVTLSGSGAGTRLYGEDNSAGAEILLLQASNWTVKDLLFNGYRHAITIEGNVWNLLLRGLTLSFGEGDGGGIYLTGTSDAAPRRVTITGCSFTGGGGDSLVIGQYCQHVTVSGNAFYGWSALRSAGSYVTVTGNTFYDCKISLEAAATHNTFSGNSVQFLPESEVGAYRLTVSGQYNTIAGNSIFSPNGDPGAAIKLDSQSRRNLVLGNNLAGGVVVDDGADNLVALNTRESDAEGLFDGGFALQADVEAALAECVKNNTTTGDVVIKTGVEDSIQLISKYLLIEGEATVNDDLVTHSVLPEADNTYPLGTVDAWYKAGYIRTLNAGDVNLVSTDADGATVTQSLLAKIAALEARVAALEDPDGATEETPPVTGDEDLPADPS